VERGGYVWSAGGLAEAIQAGDAIGVKRLLDAGIDPKTQLPGPDWHTPLTLAARLGHTDIVRVCLAQGAEVNVATLLDSLSSTPLADTLRSNYRECVQILLAHKFDRRQATLDETLIWAARAHNNEAVRMLLDAGANASARGVRSHSPLSRAVERRWGSWDEPRPAETTVQLLLSALTDPAKRRRELKHALRFAVYDQAPQAVRYLLSQAPDLYDEPDDRYRERPIYGASVRGDAEMLRLLLACGPCSIEDSGADLFHDTPLMAAVLKGRLNAVRVLVEAGADVRARDSRGDTPLMFACHRDDSSERAGIAAYLLEHGAPLDDCDREGRTPVMIAIAANNLTVAKTLLSYDPDLSVCDRKGRTVLELAREAGPAALALLAR
jgi:ankyrin repeat protein